MIKQFEFNHFQVNCYLIIDERTKQCAIVDPATEASYEDTLLTKYIASSGLKPVYILLTHPHIDHVAGLQQVCQHYQLPVTMHPEGVKILHDESNYGNMMGFSVDGKELKNITVNEINDGDNLMVGTLPVEARYVPGHCPGSLCFVVADDRCVITGDTLFRFSIGRSDLEGGDHELLVEKIRTRLLTLPTDYIVLPGHGIDSTIGRELKYNPYLVD